MSTKAPPQLRASVSRGSRRSCCSGTVSWSIASSVHAAPSSCRSGSSARSPAPPRKTLPVALGLVGQVRRGSGLVAEGKRGLRAERGFEGSFALESEEFAVADTFDDLPRALCSPAVERAVRAQDESARTTVPRPGDAFEADELSGPVAALGHHPFDGALAFDVPRERLLHARLRELAAVIELFPRVLVPRPQFRSCLVLRSSALHPIAGRGYPRSLLSETAGSGTPRRVPSSSVMAASNRSGRKPNGPISPWNAILPSPW